MKTVPFTTFSGGEFSPTFSPDGSQIAFSWDGDKGDNFDIYVKLTGAGRPLRLTTDTGRDISPAWSPDGRHIAYGRFSEREMGIFIIPALGGPERKLHSGIWDEQFWMWRLSWSPDGKTLAFSEKSSTGDTYNISLLSVESLEKRILTTPGATHDRDFFPAFSPDRKTLAFIQLEAGFVEDIYLVPIAGGEPKRLTFDDAGIGGLDWTPDGKDIVFSSRRLGASGLWRISASGGEPIQLPVGGERAFEVSISRHGHRLAYVQTSIDTNIWRIEVPGSEGRSSPPTTLISSSRRDAEPHISPDGERIVFTSTRSGNTEVWVCDSDGSNPVQLTSLDRYTGSARWSPDGREIAFDSVPEDNADIYVVSAEGGLPRRLTTEASDDIVPNWSRDGRWIYFGSNRSGRDELWKMPSQGGKAVQVTKQGGFVGLESPDGRYLYYTKAPYSSGIWKMPVEGGEETPVLQGLRLYHQDWAVVEDGIYLINRGAIEFLSFATNGVTELAAPGKEMLLSIGHLAASPDGRWILYGQDDQSNSDIMLVENFRW